jgi:competence protein ComEA
MDTKKFIIMLACLTAAFCALIAVFNFASMPPYTAQAASAVPLYTVTQPADLSAASQSGADSSDSETAADSQSAEDSVSSAPDSSSTISAAAAQQEATLVKTASSKAAKSSSSSSKKTSTAAASRASTSGTAASSASVSKTTAQNPVNINTATLEQLEEIPEIGATKAQAILDYRSQNGAFKSVDELDNVKGIGQKTLDKIKSYITV